jgi:demethylmenaquinone methyltransferase/2-methoxy-6-polyprenyl-1,4-benzoquinol methylase
MYQQSEPETIQALFASIAKNYDLANSLFSFGLHKIWNRTLAQTLTPAYRLLDLCAGTGEIAWQFLKANPQSQAFLLDFCAEMLAVADKKGTPYKERYTLMQADAQAIPLANSSVDSVSIAYGIRNVKEPSLCFQEVFRVLQPGGRFGILELTRPASRLMRQGHSLYTHLLLPLVGKAAAKNKDAYRYLAKSVATFASPENLEMSLKTVGFQLLERRPLSGGIATLILAKK